MRRYFGMFAWLLLSTLTQVSWAGTDPTPDSGIAIHQTIENNMILIDVDEQLTGSSITVSVFNSIGEIVLKSALGIGHNKLSVHELEAGSYVAVVRQNGKYVNKQSFEIR